MSTYSNNETKFNIAVTICMTIFAVAALATCAYDIKTDADHEAQVLESGNITCKPHIHPRHYHIPENHDSHKPPQ